jgi:hypothetical protein
MTTLPVEVLLFDDGTFKNLGAPRIVDYREAEGVILKWQAAQAPAVTIVLLDQPANTARGLRAGVRRVP